MGTEPGQGLGLEQVWESLGEAEVPADRWGCGGLAGTMCDSPPDRGMARVTGRRVLGHLAAANSERLCLLARRRLP